MGGLNADCWGKREMVTLQLIPESLAKVHVSRLPGVVGRWG